jgi:hypothetical protein
VHNGSTAIFGEFNRSRDKFDPLVCARDFGSCDAWKQKIEASSQLSGSLADGGRLEISLFCGQHGGISDFNPLIRCTKAETCHSSYAIQNFTCLLARTHYSGGDPTSAHYSEPEQEDEGLSAGDIAAIVLGVILGLGIITVIVLVALGKLKWASGAASIANTPEPEAP